MAEGNSLVAERDAMLEHSIEDREGFLNPLAALNKPLSSERRLVSRRSTSHTSMPTAEVLLDAVRSFWSRVLGRGCEET